MVNFFSRFMPRWRQGYDRLPTTTIPQDSNNLEVLRCGASSVYPIANKRFLRRLSEINLVLALVLALRLTVSYWSGVPDYEDVKAYEQSLPQHDLSLPYPEGLNGRYVKFNVPYMGLGWNNVLQDIIMMSEIAFQADRGYVFPSYIWSSTVFSPVVIDDFTLRSASIPLNAFIGGPIAGGQFNTSIRPPHPRSISYDWWEAVCPPERRTVVNVQDTRAELGLLIEPSGRDVLSQWAQKLSNMTESCVVVDGAHILSFVDYTSARLTSAWDLLSKSPMLNQMTWSPLVQSIVLHNLPLLTPISPSLSQDSRSRFTVPSTFSDLLAVHLRRGDFEAHCRSLRDKSTSYNAWNTFTDYPDRFPMDPTLLPSEIKAGVYTEHCYPSLDQILRRLKAVKSDWETSTQSNGRKLARVFIMTNADPKFHTALHERLRQQGWESVVTSADLVVPRGAKEVAVAADMLIGVNAEVFLGNGFSSLTSNINLIRRTKGRDPSTSRFW